MGKASESQAVFNIFSDQNSREDDDPRDPRDPQDPQDPPSRSEASLKHNRFVALRQIPVSQSQNRQTSIGSSTSAESHPTRPKKLHVSNENFELNPAKPKYKHRLTRPIIAPDTFHCLQTVPESEGEFQDSSESAEAGLASSPQRCLELPVDQFANHPLSKAARNIPSAKEQLAKHRDGQFEWVLLVRFPIQSTADSDSGKTSSSTEAGVKKAYFGCNLVQSPKQTAQVDPMKTETADTYVLLVTPIDENEEPIKMELRPPKQEDVVPPEVRLMESTPKKVVATSPEDEQLTPSSARSISEHGSPMSVSASRSSSRRLSRIEDSVEALDKLEEQLEAFDQAALFHRVSSQEKRKSVSKKPSIQTLSTSGNRDVKPTTPQPRRNTMKSGSATVRVKYTAEPRRTPSIRKAVSMTFLNADSSNVKGDERPLVQGSSKHMVVPRPSSLNPPKQPVKSTKPPTIPSFELPGEATARRLKERREARAAAQAAAEQASKPAPSLRRSKSARAPIIPTFELPGEAISRRKREEREVQLRAQEEEERRRREFKARPIRSGAAPSSYPRETIASRARQQNKTAAAENASHRSSSFSPNKSDAYPNGQPPLSNSNNESQPRGRGLHAESSAESHLNRATSHASSTGSGKRSVLSADELEQQRLRGQVIYKKDSSLSEARMREKKEREALAKLAREEAAERSRQLSREWAAKQARKRMTISSLRDIAA